MELFDPTLMGLQRAMSGAQMRQELLANNLANANTPGFRRSDLDFHAALAQAFGNGASASSPSSANVAATQFQAVQDGGQMRADGNDVDVDSEMSKLAQNSLDYQSLVSAMSARVKILETAIRGS
jgi:flagellar basal-body rod protein FlgB